MAIPYMNRRAMILQRYDELIGSGKTESEVLAIMRIKASTLANAKADVDYDGSDITSKTRVGTFGNALKALRIGKRVRRADARWFVAIIDDRICLYVLDGAGNVNFKGIATFTSADVLSYDWELF